MVLGLIHLVKLGSLRAAGPHPGSIPRREGAHPHHQSIWHYPASLQRLWARSLLPADDLDGVADTRICAGKVY